jgi:hypothetical protein
MRGDFSRQAACLYGNRNPAPMGSPSGRAAAIPGSRWYVVVSGNGPPLQCAGAPVEAGIRTHLREFRSQDSAGIRLRCRLARQARRASQSQQEFKEFRIQDEAPAVPPHPPIAIVYRGRRKPRPDDAQSTAFPTLYTTGAPSCRGRCSPATSSERSNFIFPESAFLLNF